MDFNTIPLKGGIYNICTNGLNHPTIHGLRTNAPSKKRLQLNNFAVFPALPLTYTIAGAGSKDEKINLSSCNPPPPNPLLATNHV